MKPLDPRLLKYARSARTVLGVGGLLGAVRAVAVLAWSWFLAQSLTIVVLPVLGGMGGGAGRIGEGSLPPGTLPWLIGGALLAACVRALAGWGMDVLAARGAVRVKTQLRAAALDTVDASSPVRDHAAGSSVSDAELATTLGRGLDALDGYFSSYLPQLILTVVATPILLAAVFFADPLSGTIALIVFPVIPLFMVLIGLATHAVQDKQWAQLQRLSSSFLDATSGLATLKIFRREGRQAARIARETEEYRSRTMQVLRVTFLSGFVLDLAGTFSVALVAVTVGTRLVSGEFSLALSLFVLLLMPEVFIPIRQVGAAFHASTEGLAASERVFDVIEGSGFAPRAAASALQSERALRGLRIDNVMVARGEQTTVGPVSLSVAPGEIVGLAGPSGIGKSTLLAAVLGFVGAQSGAIERPHEISWVGQRPGLMQGSVAENVALGEAAPDLALVLRALERVGLTGIDAGQQLGALGAGLSGGQAQRVSIARCLYRAWVHDTPLLLLDEPTSALDAENEAVVAQALRREAESGRSVLVVSHRPALLEAADRVVQFEGVSA